MGHPPNSNSLIALESGAWRMQAELLIIPSKRNIRDAGEGRVRPLILTYGQNPELKALSELITGNIFFLKLDNRKSSV